MTWSVFACDIVTLHTPGAGASTNASSAARDDRIDSELRRRAMSPPNRTSEVTHLVFSKKSCGNATGGAAGAAASDAFAFAFASSSAAAAPPPTIPARGCPSRIAAATRSRALFAARAVCFCWRSAAETPGGGGGSRAKTCSDPSSRSTRRNAHSRSVG